MSNEEIVGLLQAGSDSRDDLLMQLWIQNQGLICRIVRRYSGKAEEDDLMQEAFLSLIHAVDLWKPEKDALFMSYAGLWIRQRLARKLENDSLLPSYMYQRVHRYRRDISEHEKEYAERPSGSELPSPRHIGMSAEELASIINAEKKLEAISLDTPIETDGGSVSLGDLLASDLADPEETALDEAEQEELQAVLWPMIDELPDDQPEVLRKKYQEGKTLRQIQEETGHTVSQIRSTERKALKELRKPKRARKLRPFWDDDEIRSSALKGNGISGFRRTWTSSTERTALKMAEKA